MKVKFVKETMQMPFRNDSNKVVGQKYPLDNMNYLGDAANDNKVKRVIKPTINTTDAWHNSNANDEEFFDPDEVDVDVSDMVDTDTIDVEDDVFDDNLLRALSNEVKLLEPSRRIVEFRLKGNLKKILYGIPMAKLGENAFLFKLRDGSMKKIFLRDMVLENEKPKNRAKMVNEDIFDDENYLNKDYDSVTYILTDGREIEMVEQSMPGMAGEPMTVHTFIDTKSGKKLSYRDIKNLLNDEDRLEIRDVLDDDAESNNTSAINWVK